MITDDDGEKLPEGGYIVKVRAFAEDGEFFVGYASRELIKDKN